MTESDWRARAQRHADRLSTVVLDHLDRSSKHQSHPVVDFLFQYYRFSPAQLLRWSPGTGVVLGGTLTPDILAIKEGVVTDEGWTVDPVSFPQSRRDPLQWVITLQKAIADRPGRFGCFGLHEWAMVYRSEKVRHPQLPLRLPAEETDRVVESAAISCSHYDAFRFFTQPAKPLNRQQPDLKSRQDLEQNGCLHVNMDLYKWSSMFYPWVSSDLIADCFLLALEIRKVDMRASPYDVTGFGYEPVCIETEEGREEYRAFQKTFAEKAKPLRERLIEELGGMLNAE